MEKLKNIIILSSKSTGSSALQSYFEQNGGFESVNYTTHNENETLYWSKVASVLGKKQDSMYKSMVPFKKEEALRSLEIFLNKNTGFINQEIGSFSLADFQNEYLNLIKRSSGRFVEKSPHHLYNKSDLELICETVNKFSNEVDFYLIGLIRHPLAVIYSAWKRWNVNCVAFEKEWLKSYKNLLWLKERSELKIFRYEDLVLGHTVPEIELGLEEFSTNYKFHSSSLYKYKKDTSFSYKLSKDTMDIAKEFGYTDFDNKGIPFYWYLGSKVSKLQRKFK